LRCPCWTVFSCCYWLKRLSHELLVHAALPIKLSRFPVLHVSHLIFLGVFSV
jgi:hypothetical protein